MSLVYLTIYIKCITFAAMIKKAKKKTVNKSAKAVKERAEMLLIAEGGVKMLFALAVENNKANAQFISNWMESWIASLVEVGFNKQQVAKTFLSWQADFEANNDPIDEHLNRIFNPKIRPLSKKDVTLYDGLINKWVVND